jgi:hypothetical protein
LAPAFQIAARTPTMIPTGSQPGKRPSASPEMMAILTMEAVITHLPGSELHSRRRSRAL